MSEKNAFDLICAKRPREQIIPPKPVKKNKNSITMNDQDDSLYKILSWRDSFKPYTKPAQDTYKVRETSSIVGDDESKWGSNFQGIFADVDWSTQSMEDFKKLKFNDELIDNGIVFIWIPKNHIGQIMDYFAQKGFMYVQNFIFTLLDRKKIPQKKKKPDTKYSLNHFFKNSAPKQQSKTNKNQKLNVPLKDYETGKVDDPKQIFLNQPTQYFLQSQKILFLFRKIKKNQALQLRHQRTSDAFFTIGNGAVLDQKSKAMVYQMIQTLLIKANYVKNGPLKLLQLWGNSDCPRKGWVSICQKEQEKVNQ